MALLLFCILASAASQSAECFSSPMAQKGKSCNADFLWTSPFKTSATCLQGERTMKWRGRPQIGGQDSDRVSHRCSAPYTLLPLRGISPQGETRNLRRKTESHILHVPLRHSPFGGWRHHLLPTVRWYNTPCLLVEPLTK